MLRIRDFCSTLLRRTSTCSASVANQQPISSEDAYQNNKTDQEITLDFDYRRNKRYALLLCYHGEKYMGLQFVPFGDTIESKLFPAFYKAGVLDENIYNHDRYKIGYTRASRTDKGVSALRQTVALSLSEELNVEEVNLHLPSDIRILGCKRVIKTFNAQKWCDYRSYCYIMPSFALCHWEKEKEPRVNYRIDANTLNLTNQIFKGFEGTHKFHNYTEKRDMWDNRSVRSIISASVSDVFLHGNLEMVAFHIKGKSFMLHQIRRMIGMTIALMRGRFSYDCLKESFSNPLMPAPTAPSLGLMLEKQYFDNYNIYHRNHLNPLTWDEYDHDVEKFKLEVIVPRIVELELTENVMENFLDQIKKQTFTVSSESSKRITIGNWHGLELDEDDMKIIAKHQ